jgi:hypothetical protein
MRSETSPNSGIMKIAVDGKPHTDFVIGIPTSVHFFVCYVCVSECFDSCVSFFGNSLLRATRDIHGFVYISDVLIKRHGLLNKVDACGNDHTLRYDKGYVIYSFH